MEKTILIPYTLYKIDYTAHSQRLVTDLDFAILTLIKNNRAENNAAPLNFNDLKTELCLPARFVSEMISKLMEIGLCYIDQNDIIRSTRESETIKNIEELQRYQGSEPTTKTNYLCRENLTGLFYQKSGYEHKEMTHNEVIESLKWSSENKKITDCLTRSQDKLIIKDAVDNCDLGEARNFIERIEKKASPDNMLSDISIEVSRKYSWKYRDNDAKYNFLEITEKDGKLKNVPDEFSNSIFFQRKLKEIYGIKELNRQIESEEPSYFNVKREDIRIIKTKHEHHEILIDALKHAKSQVLLHTAHIGEKAINKTLIDALSATLNRGVTISIRVGFEEHFKIAELQKRLSKEIASATNLLISPHPTNSDAKLLVYDNESNETPFTAIIGSYNWLFETFLSKKEFSDVSIKSTATQLNVKLLEKFPGELLTPWWAEQCKVYSMLSHKSCETDDLLRIGLLTNREHEEYWLNLPDRENVILASYRISPDNPILQQMANKEDIYFIYGRKEPDSSVENNNSHYVEDMHARLCVEKDKHVIITSYSFLSARFDGSKTKESNHLGIRIIDKALSNYIWDSLIQLTGRN